MEHHNRPLVDSLLHTCATTVNVRPKRLVKEARIGQQVPCTIVVKQNKVE